MRRFLRFFLILLSSLFLTSCLNGVDGTLSNEAFPGKTLTPSTASDEKAVERNKCLKTYEDFLIPLYEVEADIVLPLEPWQVEATIPGFPETNPIELIRRYNDDQEIWLKNNFVYNTNHKTWKEVPRKVPMPVGETGSIHIRYLFVTSNGDVWGQNEWDVRTFDKKPIPLLSKFDESNQQFKFALNVLEVLPRMQYDSPIWPVVVLDDEDVFWIFDTSGEIYSYDTNNKKTKKHTVSIPDSFATQVALSTDGSMYFQAHKVNNLDYLSQGDLFMFDPKKNKIFPVDVPNDPWPIFLRFSMFLDHSGNLWIDSLGYRDSKGYWHLTFPDKKQYYSHLGEPEWFIPILHLESSDGRLWFYKATDILSVDGTAWYNPQSGEGCVFTNLPAKVFEDNEKKLWLSVDGKLYKHP